MYLIDSLTNYQQDLGANDPNISSHHRTEPDPSSHDSNDGSSHSHHHHQFPEVPQHPLPPRFHDNPNNDYPTDVPPPPPSSYHPPPTGPSDSSYPHPYNHQPYHQDMPPPPPPPPSQNYLPHEPSPNTLPNFQSYPSFSESSLPSTPPSHYPTHYQNPEPYYSSPHSAPAPSSSAPPYSSSNGRVNIAPAPPSPPAEKYHYDSSYQPGPEKIAEAHKAARFAVGALAFDEISTAVEHLKKSLELLTNPSAGH